MMRYDLEPLEAENARSPRNGFWLRLLNRAQLTGVAVLLAMTLFLPQSLSSVAVLVLLLPIWMGATVLGLVSLVKGSEQRPHALSAILTVPVGYAVLAMVSSRFNLPLVHGAGGDWLFLTSLAAYPVYRMTRWFLRASPPTVAAYDTLPPRDPSAALSGTGSTAMVAGVLYLLWVPLLLVSLALLMVLLRSDHDSLLYRFFEDGAFETCLTATGAIAVLAALPTLPYAVLALARGVQRLLALGLLLLCSATGLCLFAVLLFIGSHAVG